MKYQKLGESGIDVSVISMGCWGIGGGSVWSDLSPDVKEVRDLLCAAKDRGINYLDTAPVYGVGRSETILGEALKGIRDQFVVQTKVSLNWRDTEGEFEYERDGKMVYKNHHAYAIRTDVEDSLTRLQTDYLDSVVVHRMSSTVPVSETMQELMKLKKEGKIRAIILSNSKPSDFEAYASFGEVDGVQEKFSLLSPDNQSYFETCRNHHAVFQVYGSLEEGALTGRKFLEKSFGKNDVRTANGWNQEPVSKALKDMYDALETLTDKYHCSYANLFQAWTLKQYENLNLLTGFRHVSTMDDTCKVFDVNLSDADASFIDQQADKVRKMHDGKNPFVK